MQIKITIPDGKRGKWEVETFTLPENEALVHNLREKRGFGRFIKAGVPYKRLLHLEGNGLRTTMMSNTPAEIWDLLPFLRQATGDVLIFGLGLGVVLQALHQKKRIRSITVVEIDEQLIDFIGAYYMSMSPKIRCVHANALEYYEDKRYDAIWFDIWDRIDEENLSEMKTLKQRWKKNAPVRMCWAEKQCKALAMAAQNFRM